MLCPHCFTALKLLNGPPTRIGCPKCGGRWHSFKIFEQKIGPGACEELLSIAKQAAPTGKTCPHCEKKMHPLRTAENKTPLDVCFICESIWFDFMEFESFQTKRNPLGEGFAKMRKDVNPIEFNGIRAEVFEVGLFGSLTDPRAYDAPITDQPPVRGFPVITYMVALACLIIFLKSRNDIAQFWESYAFQAGQIGIDQLKRLMESFFIHASWGHMIGNMYLFCLIGAPAEDVSSPWDFLIVLVGGHIAGTILQSLISEPGTLIAGASAGVFSVLVYYAILFPKSRFQVTNFFRSRDYTSAAIRYSIPIQLYVALMVAGEIINLYLQNETNIAHLAHLGGGAVGMVMGLSQRTK